MNDDDIDADAALTADEKTLLKQQREKLKQFMTKDAWKALEAIDVLNAVLQMKDRVLNPSNFNPAKALIFRITHIANVPWLLEHGLHARNSSAHDPNLVDWLVQKESVSPEVSTVREGLRRWPAGADAGERKQRLFDDRLLDLALARLSELAAPSSKTSSTPA